MRFQHTLKGHMHWVRCAQFSPDGRMVASGGDDKTVKLWDAHNAKCVGTFYEHTGCVMPLFCTFW